MTQHFNPQQSENSGWDILRSIEQHCGEDVTSKRLREHLAGEFDHLLEKHANLRDEILRVLSGHVTYDRKTHKRIRRPKSEVSHD